MTVLGSQNITSIGEGVDGYPQGAAYGIQQVRY